MEQMRRLAAFNEDEDFQEPDQAPYSPDSDAQSRYSIASEHMEPSNAHSPPTKTADEKTAVGSIVRTAPPNAVDIDVEVHQPDDASVLSAATTKNTAAAAAAGASSAEQIDAPPSLKHDKNGSHRQNSN